MNINDIYVSLCKTPSDINEHLSKLKEIVEKYKHITEFGVRGAVSTWALLAGKPTTLISYDIGHIDTEYLSALSKLENINFIFKQNNTCLIEIEETDVLFIDTLHTYKQLKTELTLHHNKVKHCIIMHDTFAYGTTDMINCYSVNGPYANIHDNVYGLQSAINEFLLEQPNWKKIYETNNNNGLVIIEKLNENR